MTLHKELGLPCISYRVKVLTDTRVEIRTNNETNVVNYLAGVYTFRRKLDATIFISHLAARHVFYIDLGKSYSATHYVRFTPNVAVV